MIEPSLDTYISKRFESIVREYFFLVSDASVLDIGTYWHDDRKRHVNGEFDCVLKLLDGSYKVYEVKDLKHPMEFDMYKEEKKKMENMGEMKISSYGFVSSTGFSFDTEEFSDIFISGEDLYKKE